MSARAPLVLVTVGTEHYPFDRLVRWVDDWLASEGAREIRCITQYGVSAPPTRAEGRAYLPFQEMENAIREAMGVVCHGGTGTVMLAKHLGVRPIVVPRTRRLGEHVDDHQVDFARRMASLGQIEIAETEERLRELLDDVLSGRLVSRTAAQEAGVPASVERFRELADALLSKAPGRGR